MIVDSYEIGERFISKTELCGDDGTCWGWTAGLTGQGYGKFKAHGKTLLTHRVAWEWLKGPIPDGMFVDHLCRNRRCCNPEHLRIVSPTQNALENSESICAINAKKTHCLNGHEFTPENTYVMDRPERPGKVRRSCKKCLRDREKVYRRRMV